jgi:hypothetical protein
MVMVSLSHKLKLKPGLRAALLNMPDGYLVELAPERVSIDYTLSGQYDWIQIFVKTTAELESTYPALLMALKTESLLWISFPKGNSGIQTDLSRDAGWDVVQDLKRINLVSINPAWSAFSLRPYRPSEPRDSSR